MKILAIRGKNLASLAGEFELRFHREPLASTGLFAICGPTGSGKSTLLDALCLALYDDTPRLTQVPTTKNAGLPDVGEDTITPQDPRNLLRRRAGEGYAEVDFVGNDGIGYRARWSVRRARGKSDGKLQHTEMSLETLDGGQRIGGVKTEVQQAIRERLGLSFVQFTRAVLLAQNEFATFLKADDNERAELLQTLTGLDIYTALSIRAFERARTEQRALETLQAQLAGQQPLDAVARAQRELALATARTETAALEQRKAELDRQLQWQEAWETLKTSEQQAQEDVQKAKTIQDVAATRQHTLARIEAVQEARPSVMRVDRLADEIVQQRQAVSAAAEHLTEAQRVQQQADEALMQATTAVTVAEQARIAASADLDRAKALDAEIATLLPHHAEVTKALAEARRLQTQAQQHLTDQHADRARTAQNLQLAQDWLTAHEALRLLAEDWSGWDLRFTEAAKAQHRVRAAHLALAAKQQDQQKQQQLQAQAAVAVTKAATAWRAAEMQLQAALQTLAACDPETLAARRASAESRREQLVSGEQRWNALAGARTRQQALAAEVAIVQDQRAQAERALHPLLAAQPMTAARLEQAEKSLKIAEAACADQVETLRERLEVGSPCPVCGATEHPYTVGDAPSRALLNSLELEVSACRQAQDALVKQEAAQQAHLESTRLRLLAIATEQEPLTVAIQRDSSAWHVDPVATELATVALADRPTWFADQQQKTHAQLIAIAQEEHALRQATKVRDEAQKVRDQAQQRHFTAREALNAAQAALDQTVQALQTETDRQEETTRQLHEQLVALDAAFSESDWRGHWQADPTAFHRIQREQAAQWNAKNKTSEQLQIRLGTFDVEMKTLEIAAAEKTAHLEKETARFAQVDRDVRDKRESRYALFQGQAVAVVEAALVHAVHAAHTHLQQLDRAARDAAQTQSNAATRLEQAQHNLTASQQAANQAELELHHWMADFNARHPAPLLELSELRALLTHNNDWLIREREALRRLDAAVQSAKTVHRERQSQRAAHEQKRTTLDSVDAIHAAGAQLTESLTQTRQCAIEVELALRQDDERTAKTAELQVNINAQAAKTVIWGQLNDLIGSANGTKFRNYAQQFTLDVLIGYANRHLADLSRRYRLERVKNTLALMVVDQDMGDEFRSVHSLSGGESFLVSLALALGLASLSSNRVQVESLFIDEGFGSLDADTLRMAMDALDNLQAQGRKVGIISHVQEMTERIGIQIQVRRQSGGQSRIEVASG